MLIGSIDTPACPPPHASWIAIDPFPSEFTNDKCRNSSSQLLGILSNKKRYSISVEIDWLEELAINVLELLNKTESLQDASSTCTCFWFCIITLLHKYVGEEKTLKYTSLGVSNIDTFCNANDIAQLFKLHLVVTV